MELKLELELELELEYDTSVYYVQLMSKILHIRSTIQLSTNDMTFADTIKK